MDPKEFVVRSEACLARVARWLEDFDPDAGVITPLFDPRRQTWSDHFQWDGLEMVGLTAVGRTTVRVLNLNFDDRVEVRAWSIHPPNGPWLWPARVSNWPAGAERLNTTKRLVDKPRFPHINLLKV